MRLYPTPEQVVVLSRTFGCVRLVWNKVLAWRQDRYHAEGLRTSCAETNRYLTELQRDPGLRFYPRFESRQARRSATFTRSASRRREARLYMATMMDTPVELVWSWPEVDPASIEPTSVTVSSDGEKPGSNNRAKAEAKVTRAHRKVAASRAGHKTSTRLVRDHDMIVIDRWYPGSQTRSACGHRLAELPLFVRAWCCPSCRTLHDRDLNAATNILAAGHAASACGGDVRHPGSSQVRSPAKQEPQPARAGIPALQREE